jgi:hypothetical protein
MRAPLGRFMTCHWLLGCFALFCVVPSLATSPPGATVLEGTVINKITGAPVKSAHVLYIKISSAASDNPDPLSVDTDGGGHFEIQMEAGSYRVWAERPGYARQVYGSRTSAGSGAPVTLEPGQQVRDLQIKLTPLGAISGEISDENGEPLQGVGLQVLRFSYSTGTRQLIPVGGASSDDRGAFRAYNLPAGRYLLLATPRGVPLSHPMEAGALVPQAQDRLAPLYYPGVLDPASASEILVAEGGEVSGINFHVTRTHAQTVRGRLLSPADNFGGSELQIVLAHREGNLASYIDRASGAVDKSSGRFEFPGVAPGSYWLVASQLYRGQAFSTRVPVEVGETNSPDELAVSLSPSFPVEGRIAMPPEGMDASKLVVRFAAADGLGLGPPPSSRVAADGSFLLAGVTRGVWSVSLGSLSDPWWIRAMTYGESDALAGPIAIMSGQPAALSIVLAGNGGEVAGKIDNAASSSQVSVVLVPSNDEKRKSAAFYRAVPAQDSGVYTFKAVRPGVYDLYALEEAEPFSWLDADVVNSIKSLGETVSVAEGERVTRNLTVIPAEALLPKP